MSVNMKKLIYIIFIIFILLKLSACFPDPLKIDLPVYEPKLVVSSQFASDSGVYLTLSRSFSALIDNYLPEKINIDFINKVFSSNALVLIKYNGIIDTLLNVAPGIYSNPDIPVFDYTIYELFIYDTLLESTITSYTTVLPEVIFDTVYPEFIVNTYDTTARMHYSFTDLSGYNYYMVNYYKEHNDSAFQSLFNFDPNDPLFEPLLDSLGYTDLFNLLLRLSSIGNDVESTVLINEDDINADSYSGYIDFYDICTDDTLYLTIGNISEAYYNYLDYREKSGSLYSQILGEPINMPTNIDSGYGLFTGHRQYYKPVYLSEY